MTERCWPLPRYRDGRAPRISDGYHSAADVQAGRATREHPGVDLMYRRPKAGEPSLPNFSKHFECPPDTPVVACGDGVIVISEEAPKGGYILINHEDGTASQYMHLARRDLAPGDRVFMGAIIGLVGFNTQKGGYALRHLHFQLRRGFKTSRMIGLRVDPEPLLKTWEFWPWPL